MTLFHRSNYRTDMEIKFIAGHRGDQGGFQTVEFEIQRFHADIIIEAGMEFAQFILNITNIRPELFRIPQNSLALVNFINGNTASEQGREQ
jgi:hypothetical protein